MTKQSLTMDKWASILRLVMRRLRIIRFRVAGIARREARVAPEPKVSKFYLWGLALVA